MPYFPLNIHLSPLTFTLGLTMASPFKPFKYNKAGEAYVGSGGLMQYMAYKKSGLLMKKEHGTHKRGSGRLKKAVTVAK